MVGDKEYFIRHFNAVYKHWGKTIGFSGALATICDGAPIVTLGHELMEAHVEMLSETCAIDKEMIEWVLYEGGGKAYKNNKEYDIHTAQDLWNFYKE